MGNICIAQKKMGVAVLAVNRHAHGDITNYFSGRGRIVVSRV
jgi:hypothetical protein